MPHTPSTRFHLWITMRQHRGAKQSRTRGSRSQPPLGDTRKRQRHVKSRAVTTTHGTEKDALPALHLQNPIFRAPPCETDAERYHLLMVAVQDAKKWGEKMPAWVSGLHRAQRETHSCTTQRKTCGGLLAGQLVLVLHTATFRPDIFRQSLAL